MIFVQWHTVDDQVPQFFFKDTLIRREHVFPTAVLKLHKLVLLMLSEVHHARMTRVYRLPCSNQSLVLTKFLLFCGPQCLLSALFLLKGDQVAFLIGRQIDDTSVLRVQWVTVHDQVFEVVQLFLLVSAKARAILVVQLTELVLLVGCQVYHAWVPGVDRDAILEQV